MHSHGAPAPEDTPGRTAHSDTCDTPKEKKYAKQGTRGGRLLLMLLRPVSPGRREAGKGNRGRLQYWGDVFVHCDIVVGRAEGSRWGPTATSECRCRGGNGEGGTFVAILKWKG